MTELLVYRIDLMDKRTIEIIININCKRIINGNKMSFQFIYI